MNLTITLAEAIKIFKKLRMDYTEDAQNNIDIELALKMALSCMERINLINDVINVDGIQENALKYQMICNIVKGSKEVSLI